MLGWKPRPSSAGTISDTLLCLQTLSEKEFPSVGMNSAELLFVNKHIGRVTELLWIKYLTSVLCHNSVPPSHAVPVCYWSSHLCTDLPCWLHSVEENLKLGCESFRAETLSSYSCLCPFEGSEQHRPQPHEQWAYLTVCSWTLSCSQGRARR